MPIPPNRCVTVRLDDEMHLALAQIAETSGVGVNDVIRAALAAFLGAPFDLRVLNDRAFRMAIRLVQIRYEDLPTTHEDAVARGFLPADLGANHT